MRLEYCEGMYVACRLSLNASKLLNMVADSARFVVLIQRFKK